MNEKPNTITNPFTGHLGTNSKRESLQGVRVQGEQLDEGGVHWHLTFEREDGKNVRVLLTNDALNDLEDAIQSVREKRTEAIINGGKPAVFTGAVVTFKEGDW